MSFQMQKSSGAWLRRWKPSMSRRLRLRATLQPRQLFHWAWEVAVLPVNLAPF